MSGLRIYPKNSGGGGTMDHNALQNLQGGSAGQYNHTTDEQHSKLLDLIYKNQVSSISVAPAFGERGVAVPLTVSYQIQSNDDVFGEAQINYGVGNVSGNVDAGLKSVGAGNFTATLTFILSLAFYRKGNATADSKTAVYNAYIPQWSGVSAMDNFSSRSQIIASGVQKYIQPSASIERNFSPEDQYLWFVSTKPDAVIKDGNNFTQTTGEWNDGRSEFYRREFLLTLADNTTVVPVYFYRSRNKKTFSNLTYKIS